MIFIKGNCPSLKNSKRIVSFRGKGGKYTPRLLPSLTVEKYVKNHENEYLINKPEFLKIIKEKQLPIKLGLFFVRDSKRKFDFINAAQIVQDLMVKHGWIEDDNCDNIIPVFLGYKVDPKNPGVEITIQ